MQERGVIDVEQYLADGEEWRVAICLVVDAKVLCDEAAKWIEREPAHGRFDPALPEFLDNLCAPLPAEAFVREIPTAPKQDREKGESQQSQSARD